MSRSVDVGPEQDEHAFPSVLYLAKQLLQSIVSRAAHTDADSESDIEDLEKEMTAECGFGESTEDASVSEAEDEALLSPVQRRGGALAVGGAGVAALVVLLVFHLMAMASQGASSRGHAAGGDQPLPGVILQPSNQALPGLPDAVVLHPPAAATGGAADSAGSITLPGLPEPIVPAPGASETAPRRYELEVPHKPSVVFGMLIENLDFWQLTEHSNILASFNGTVKQAVASVAGNSVDSDDIALALSPGSVIVECTVKVPTADAAEKVQAALASSHRLADDLALNLEALVRIDMFQGISTGRIAVSGMSAPVIRGTTQPPSTTTGLTTSTVATPPPPTTTTAPQCLAKGASCMLGAQCCSRRCTPLHRCANTPVWV